MKRKILVTTGTRAEYGLLRPVLHEIKRSKKLDLCLIVTGMHLSTKHGKTIDLIRKDGFKISDKFSMMPKDDTLYDMSVTLGKGIGNFREYLKNLNLT